LGGGPFSILSSSGVVARFNFDLRGIGGSDESPSSRGDGRSRLSSLSLDILHLPLRRCPVEAILGLATSFLIVRDMFFVVFVVRLRDVTHSIGGGGEARYRRFGFSLVVPNEKAPRNFEMGVRGRNSDSAFAF
jgi:hypothetical protein